VGLLRGIPTGTVWPPIRLEDTCIDSRTVTMIIPTAKRLCPHGDLLGRELYGEDVGPQCAGCWMYISCRLEIYMW